MNSSASSLFMKWPRGPKRPSKVESVQMEPKELVHARQRLEQTEQQLEEQLAEVQLILARARAERANNGSG